MKKGDRVHYIPYPNCPTTEISNGIVKYIDPRTLSLFVVFHCNNDWDNYENYTAQSCNYIQLGEGWVGFTPELFGFHMKSITEFEHICDDIKTSIYSHEDYYHIIKYIKEDNDKYKYKHGNLYYGKIPNNNFAFELFKNIGILPEEELIRINRELIIENI